MDRTSAPDAAIAELAMGSAHALGGTMLISAGFDDFWGEIYTMKPDGSELTQLTDAPGFIDDAASWSPDGRRIVFHSNRTGAFNLFVMNADGSGVVQLTDGPEQDAFPQWSPNGRQIAFGRDDPAPGFRPNVFVINADGTGLTQLTNDVPAERLPIWSPNGQEILYAKRGRPDIWVMSADGSNQRPLLATPLIEAASDWSPDGRILFSQRELTTFDSAVYVMNPDGSGITQLTAIPGSAGGASFSWDMRRIVFGTQPLFNGITDIWVMNADGSDPVAITSTDTQWESILDWRPR